MTTYDEITVKQGEYTPIAPYNPIKGEWVLIFPVGEVDQDGYAKAQRVILGGFPALEDVKTAVLAWYNQEIDKEILSGFRWRDMPVWLNSENQLNYKATFDLVMQFQGGRGTLPVTFKFGHDGESVYHEFTSVDELADFYLSSVTYVKEVLSRGWAKKDAIDWSIYEQALAQHEG